MTKANPVHCWISEGHYLEEHFGYLSPEHLEYRASDQPSRTCMLLEGHSGPHEFVLNDEIVVVFKMTEDQR